MSRAKSKRRTRKRRDERRRTPQRVLKRRVGKKFSDHKVMVGPTPDGLKMSEVLEAFVRPYVEHAATEDALTSLVGTAVVAWNATLFPEEDRQSVLDEAVAGFPREARVDGRRLVEDLMERKETHFARYRRAILDFEVVDKGNSWRLLVVSTVAPM